MTTDPAWTRGLPPQYRANAVLPCHFERFEDSDARAYRMRGFDSGGGVCYYAHAYALTHPVLDEEDCFFDEESCREEITAWRLANGNWLVRRYSGGEQGACAARTAPPSYVLVDANLR